MAKEEKKKIKWEMEEGEFLRVSAKKHEDGKIKLDLKTNNAEYADVMLVLRKLNKELGFPDEAIVISVCPCGPFNEETEEETEGEKKSEE